MKNLMLKKLAGNKRKGFSLAEILIALTIIVALSTAAFFGFNNVQGTRRIAQCNQDLDNICLAITTYEALSGSTPATLTVDDLISGLGSTESIDGAAHNNILKMDNTNNPWGNEGYSINMTTREVSTKDSNNNEYKKGF